jgi:hypothetical protein
MSDLLKYRYPGRVPEPQKFDQEETDIRAVFLGRCWDRELILANNPRAR